MKQVRKTKQPSLRTLANMAENLSKKFNCFCSVDVSAKQFISGSEIDFCLYRKKTTARACICEQYPTWFELQKSYFRLMRKDQFNKFCPFNGQKRKTQMNLKNRLSKANTLMSFTDIEEETDKMIDAVFYSIKQSLENMENHEMSEDDQYSKTEMLGFIESLRDFLDVEYLKADSDFLNLILS